MIIRRAVRLSGAVLTAASAMISGSAASASPGPTATSQSFGILDGAHCVSAVNCWAVGLRNNGTATLNEILHYTGGKWQPVSVPSPGGTSQGADSELFAVRCATASDCWAVGDYTIPGSGTVNQALHWTGKHWRSVPVPSPAGIGNRDRNFLGDVTCISTSNCWAVGDYVKSRTSSAVAWNLVLHWTGKKWFKVAVPNPAGTKPGDGNELNSVRCTSASDCWAGGEDGTSPEATFAAARPAVRLTAGAGKKFFFANEMLHWNGTSWANVKVPNPGGTANLANNVINGLSCTAPSDCWAAGAFGTFKSPPDNTLNEALHWTGRKWIKTSVPNPAGTGADAVNELNAIFCVSARNCWAGGTQGSNLGGEPSFAEVVHWNGAKWSLSMIPDIAGSGPGANGTLHSIRCPSAADCWAVGEARADGGNDAELILHWNGMKWTVALGPPA